MLSAGSHQFLLSDNTDLINTIFAIFVGQKMWIISSFISWEVFIREESMGGVM